MYKYEPKKRSSRKKVNANSNLPPIGKYISEVLSVEWDPAYAEGVQLFISYKLTDDNQNTYSFSERFPYNPPSQRMNDFEDYLLENGIEDVLYNFVGCKENVLLQKVRTDSGFTYINIVERDFL